MLQRSHKTHSGVLPQPRTLEVAAADKARVATKRAVMGAASSICVATFPRGDWPQGQRHKARKGTE